MLPIFFQTEEQYIFIHDALLEAIQSGDTNIPSAGVSRYIRMLQAPDNSQEKPQPWYLLSHQYKVCLFLLPAQNFICVFIVKASSCIYKIYFILKGNFIVSGKSSTTTIIV